jgi:catechol 2,3-dioxygenase-like lactoylglutathione lyase family enzyme
VLNGNEVTAILPVRDLARARRFYENQLGLVPRGLRLDGKFIYRCGGTVLALFPRAGGTRAEHAALSFRVEDIAREVRELQARGVVFAEYDLPGLKTVDHVCQLASEKAAWFLDPEGNILCLHEDLPSPVRTAPESRPTAHGG